MVGSATSAMVTTRFSGSLSYSRAQWNTPLFYTPEAPEFENRSMPRRKAIKGVLHGFLGTFTSRYSDYDGYWVFGFITDAMNDLTINLLEVEDTNAGNDAVLFVAQLAHRKFSEQMDKEHVPLSFVRRAQMTITQSAAPAKGFAAGHLCTGHIYVFSVQVVTDLGKLFQAKAQMFVAQHDSVVEHRSTRRI